MTDSASPPARWRRPQQVECGLIGVATAGVALLSGRAPRELELGTLLAVGSIALLVQGFFRDLWILREQRRRPTPVEHASCMCLESTIGLAGILAGLVLAASGLRLPVTLAPWMWPALALAVWSTGFALRDFVVQWKPWAIRRVANHGSLIVRWR